MEKTKIPLLVYSSMRSIVSSIESAKRRIWLSRSGNWGETKKVMAHDGTDGDYFGNSIAMTDQYLLIGAYGNDQNGNKSGAAYIFKKDNNSSPIQLQ